MNRTAYTLTLFLLTLALSPDAAANKIYRWTDADGVVHYGQQKPADGPAELVTLRYKSETRAEAEAKLEQLKEEAGPSAEALADGEQKQASEQAEKVASTERKQECVIAANNLQKLGNWAKHILVNDSSGTPVTMDSDQRTAAMNRIRKWMSESNCP